MKLYQAISQNHRLVGTEQWGAAADERLTRIEALLPSGSGFDNGTKIDACDDSRIVFQTSFHHMNEGGFYDGWTNHRVTVRASLMHEFTITVSGRNRNDIKDYIAEVFSTLLNTDFDWIAPK